MKHLCSLLLLGAALSAAALPLTPRTAHLTGTQRPLIDNSISTRTPAVLYGANAKNSYAIQRAEEVTSETLIDEDFSKWSEGTNDAPKMDPTNPIADMLPPGYMQGNPYMDETWMQQPGWFGMGLFQAGGACAIAYPNNGGHISTPIRNYAGHLTVTFRMKSLPGNTASTNVVFGVAKGASGNFPTPLFTQYCTAVAGEDWQEYSIECDIEEMSEDCTIQWNVMYQQGVLLDDIKVVRDNSFVAKPIGLEYTLGTGNSFTAKWAPAFGGDRYEVEVYSETPVDNNDITIAEDIEGEAQTAGNVITLPGGVTIEGGELSATGGPNDTRAIKVTGNVVITTPYTGGLVEEAAFDLVVRPAEGLTTGGGAMYYYGFDGSTWIRYASTEYAWYPANELYHDSMKESDEWAPAPAAGRFFQVRYEFRDIPAEAPVYIDNIEVLTGPATERKPHGDIFTVSEPMLEVTDLDPEADYYFRVRGLSNAGKYSDWSDRLGVFGQAAPVVLPATDTDPRGGFTANWQYAPKAQSYVVKTYLVHTAIEDENVAIVNEAFDDVTDMGTLDNPYMADNMLEEYSLDEYTDMPGWSALMAALADGYIGVAQDYYGFAEISSPELNLSSVGGVFTVTVKGAGRYGDALIVQCDNTDYKQIAVGEDGTYEGTVTFDCGTAASRLIFYSMYQQTIFISSISVNQGLAAGESALTLVNESDAIEGKMNTSYRVSGLEPLPEDTIDYYAYTVTAKRTHLHVNYTSEPSEMMKVDLNQSGIDAVTPTPGAIVRYLDLQGRRVANPHGGIFIAIDEQGQATKVIR